MTQSSALSTPHCATPRPLPQIDVTIRPGVLSDVPFLDSLQKIHTKQVGWMPTKQFEGKIAAGHVLVAEAMESKDEGGRMKDENGGVDASSPFSSFSPHPSSLSSVGYLIGNDQYFKRDDVGIIYQMNVLPGKQRGLIGASLLKAQFERSAYGCKLYCCWCAQDIAANHFWEAMGFVPLAFRTGGTSRSNPTRNSQLTTRNYSRTHIFWQKRIRSGDASTPWWFPSQTSGGSIREDRIVLPIPPGTHWSDAKPVVLPQERTEDSGLRTEFNAKKRELPGSKATQSSALSPQSLRSPSGLWFTPPASIEPAKEKSKREKKPKQKNDPKLVAAARELRDRWLEQVNAHPILAHGKYDATRMVQESTQRERLFDDRTVAA
jgi:hypothetical protein